MNAIANRETIVMQWIGAPGKGGISRRVEAQSIMPYGAKVNIGCHALAALLPRIIEVVGVVLPQAALRGRTDKRLAFLVHGIP